MATYAAALAALKGIPVSGIPNRWGIDDAPEHLTRAHLPALIVLLDASIRTGKSPPSFGARADGLSTVPFGGEARTMTYRAAHLLLSAHVGLVSHRAHQPALVTLIDAYTATLAADPTLGGVLALPTRMDAEPGIFPYRSGKGGTNIRFHGCLFRHTWTIRLG